METEQQNLIVHWFREAAPFINAHRGRTLVVYVGGEAVAAPGFSNLMQDLALIQALGIRLVIVHGVRPQVEERLRRRNRAFRYHAGLRITDADSLQVVKEAAGAVRVEIEGMISHGVSNSPLARKGVKISSGNLVTAKPLGIRDGIDFLYTGIVRRVDVATIRSLLADDTVVLISPLGFSATGDVFNLGGRDTTIAVASELQADKLVFLVDGPVTDLNGALIQQLTVAQARALIAQGTLGAGAVDALSYAVQAGDLGISRIHLIDLHHDGGILQELFSRDGIGTMVSVAPSDIFRPATRDDVTGMLDLIQPLQSNGILIERSRQQLEAEIDRFAVLTREDTTVACGALYPFAESRTGEIACIAVHPDYQRAGFGDAILAHLEQRAKSQHLESVFVLTTQAAHWFRERGYRQAATDDLPLPKQAVLRRERNSQVLQKILS